MAQRMERGVLNHLIEICKDGERGFRAAAEHVKEPSLRALFTELATQRGQFAADLLPHAQRLGGDAASEGTSVGALHRGWMNLKGLVPGDHDHAIVSEAERGEHAAQRAYENALNGIIPPTVRETIERQCVAVQLAYLRIDALDKAL